MLNLKTGKLGLKLDHLYPGFFLVGCTTSDNRVLWKKGIKAELEEHRPDIRKAKVVFLR